MSRVALARMRSGPVSKILSGSIVGQGLLIASSPLLTRLYDGGDFGVLAVFTALVSICGVMATLKWESAIVLPLADQEARAVAWLGLITAASVTGVLAIVVTTYGSAIAAMFGSPDLAPVLWLLPVTVMLASFQKVGSSWFVRTQSYGKLGRRNLLQGVGQVVAQLAGGLFDARPLGLIIGLPAGRLAASGGFLGPSGFLRGGLPARAMLKTIAVRYRQFPIISTPSALINTIGLQAPILVLSWNYGALAIGALALTMRVLASPVGIICDAVAQYFEGEVSRQLRSGEPNIRPTIRRTIIRLALVGAVPFTTIIAIGPWIFASIFGPEWRGAGSLAQVIVFAYFAQYLVVPFSRTLMLLERQGLQLVWDTARACLTVGCVAGLTLTSASLWVSVAAFSAAQLTAYSCLFGIIWRVARTNEPREGSVPIGNV